MSALAGRAILLVEDEYLIAADAEMMLAQLGAARVDLVGDFDEAQALAAEGQFDAVILDVNLNGKLSFPIAKILELRGIPFVFATGYNLQFRPLPGFEHGICITKPYSAERLKAGLLAALHAQSQSLTRTGAAPVAAANPT
jgi:DNA-binding response OmpR family regulator